MYGPATALAYFANLNEKICIGLLGCIGTFYTAIGGIRGVIWNDLFQAAIMFVSAIIILPKGVQDAGGLSEVWRISENGQRLNFFEFNFDPFIRQSTWSILLGQFTYMTMMFSFDQQMIQRFRASRTKKIAQRALCLNVPGIFCMSSLCAFFGLLIYANFAFCDPLSNPNPQDRINTPNQLSSFYIDHIYNSFPGVAGIFLASVFCGSLSSVSSFLNSQAAIIWHDILQSFERFRSFDDSKSLTTNKLIVLICGIIATSMSFYVASIGGNLVQISNSLSGAFNAPIMGLFLLSMFFSVSTPRGVIAGTMAGFLTAIWLSIGNYLVKPLYPKAPVSTEFCPNSTYFPSLTVNLNVTRQLASDLKGVEKIYALSYMYYMPFGVLVTVVIGLFASIIDGGFRKELGAKREFIYFDLSFFCSKK